MTPTSEHQGSFSQWFPHFLRHELAPYPGRWSLVARMVLSATLSMLVIVTFRIPYGAIGVNCAFILSRENLSATAKSGFYFILAFAAWAALTPIGARMFASVPLTHFLWEGVTVFLCFFLLKTLTNFPLAAGVVVVATGTMAIWYLPGPAELNVELTLWQILATAIGALITFLVEVAFHYSSPHDPLLEGLDNRLRAIEEMLHALRRESTVPPQTTQTLTQYSVTGESSLRQYLARNGHPKQAMEINALVSLIGRSVDLAAALAASTSKLELSSINLATHIAHDVADVRSALVTEGHFSHRAVASKASDTSALLSELATTVRLMKSVLAARGDEKGFQALTSQASPANPALFVPDAFTNPEHVKYALAGTAASMICYVIYVGLDWPGISTAVTTCILTALSNIGSSRQKQLLRLVGASIGGFVLGIGSQIFILPYLDSIVGLTLLVAAATAISAYVATSSPRLSYVGLQMAFAFYLINVTDFTISLDLTIGRDRAVGILLGIGAMWFVFERLYPRPAGAGMVSEFARATRLMADFVASHEDDRKQRDERIERTRDALSKHFANISAEADAVLFETGPDRPSYLAARERIESWLSTLRTAFVLLLPFVEQDLRLAPAEIAPSSTRLEEELRGSISTSLRHIADRLETQRVYPTYDLAPQRSARQTASEPALNLIVKLVDELEHDVFATSFSMPR